MLAEPSLTEQIAAFLVATRANGVPKSVLSAAQYFTLDWIGSAVAGTATPEGRIFLEYVACQGAGPATVIGLDARRSVEAAALANGALSHVVEMDDLHRASVVHPAAAVIPAVLAVAEEKGATGVEFLAAVALGYEVAIRIGEAVGKTHYRRWHNTATCGCFGSATAAGWLLGLDVQQMTSALGSAGTMASGLWEFNTDGAMSKPLHAGRAAATGVLAAELARRGLTGARQILEGARGFFAATSQDAEPQRVVEGLVPGMADYRITGVSIKPYASCRHTHPAIDAALAVRAQPGFDRKRIARVTVETYQAALDLTDHCNPSHPHTAKFSLPYCVASALWQGSAGLADFTVEAIADPVIRALMGRVITTRDPALEARYPAQWPVRLTVTLDSGLQLRASVDYAKGDPENPLSWAELERKLASMASGTHYEAQVPALVAWVRALDRVDRLDASLLAGKRPVA